MEMKIPELEQYLIALKAELRVADDLKEDICREISQNLYDKFNELLVKGYGIEDGISYTLEGFEDPKKLAKMFNSIHREPIVLNKAIRFAYDRKPAVAAIVITLLMTLMM